MNKKISISIVFIGLITLLWAFYAFSLNVFSEASLAKLIVKQDEFSSPEEYVLTDAQKNSLFLAVDSATTPVHAPYEPDYRFSLTFVNQWNLTKSYTLDYTQELGFILYDVKNTKEKYQVAQPDFFSRFDAFDAIYSALLYPVVEIQYGNQSITPGIDSISWEYRRLDGSWLSQPLPTENDLKGNETTTLTTTNDDTQFHLTSSKLPDQVYLEILDDSTGATVYEDYIQPDAIPHPDYDGTFTYKIQNIWNSRHQNYEGHMGLSFQLSIDRPPSLDFSKLEVVQGDFIELQLAYANTPDEINLNLDFTSTPHWYKENNLYKAMIPTSYSTKTGNHTITYDIEDSQPVSLTVMARDFKVQNLIIDQSIESSTRNDKAYAELDTYFVPARKISNPDRYYDTPFVLPAQGRITTEFGEKRTVNGSLTSYRHSGLDIAAPLGTPIAATNTGKVVLAMNLIMTGNTIVIDHGAGIFSVYEHLDSLNVTENQMVEVGQTIGTMGTTGFSTGSHLHFMISHYHINMEPGYLIYGEAITKENYKDLMH